MSSEENERYKQHKRKLKDLQDSRRNMRVDMRPKVVAKIMSKELFLFLFALLAAAGMPLYFYKVHGLREQMTEKEYQKVLDKQDREEEQRKVQKQQSIQYAQGIARGRGVDLVKRTDEKLRERYSEEEIKREIERAERELEREALYNERVDRQSTRRTREL
ncbi:hypothetical protein FGO68_gene3399 [Halteria grandinella]|uniref:Uncharacterized protein n=1 Tax=Halteria grandinella TaxID=5974 RepID=A0A8J8P1R0_HALGN|nr:hypothetical protein FGO68_gene3399 [Halteria grandinella]